MQAAEEQDKVVRFYDQFAEKQEKTGINSRHLSILDKAKQAGLASNHRVLEVGCGIGTVSHLLATQVPQGKVLAVDISPESIEKARMLWKKQGNLKFDVSDMSDFNLPGETFDFFVFPDVLEHIPVAQHARLFENIQRHAHADSVVLIHIPAPRYLEWMIGNQPEKLQVIDQPLDTGVLVQTLGAAGFYLEKMETYALFFEEKDYQYFVFRAKKPVQQSTEKSKWQVLKERIIIRLKYGISS
ncbi:MAG: class I SAM-dependent methyltransferase [Algoriphagus sp.]|jgi:trans-aconitate 2-methyltransferase|uniref:class I SAM-dependent methyltransferase n=1 Tax=Algoriphagus sp. TaxID=1872435 RepID=UPI002765CD4E|nr:class I SAM-dependent methyltransferase [Algoriphagus sp.]MDP4748986.1 class I SAM-dependent methyltransferase [Algoriphagus sp.]MDP4838551.1 class I SAM-dependent methyltransferase [Algoriphagus sp.]MDP4903812.1 class I SAM-dependent methyltransferase [Algoriphagus sp.]MDP4957415.1 class I SAM-dependent methyltransferase [Algoriphagus sp.]